MLTADTMQDAKEAYRKGTSLLQQGRYPEAFPFLHQAADTFRRHAASGHPAEHILENGVTSLANALYQLGLCYERSGEIPHAITCFETARINERFENSRSFRTFLNDLEPVLVSCYERQIDAAGTRDFQALLNRDAVQDSTCRFPFSLAPKLIPCARLYELAPQRYQQYKMLYEGARKLDAALRSAGSKTDEATMRRTSFVVWTVIAAVWIAYGIVVTRTLMNAH